MAGHPGRIPPAASRPVSSTAFFNVDRSINETKLAGLYLAQPGLGALEGINQLGHAIADIPGAQPNLAVMSFKTRGKIVAQLQTEKRYTEGNVKGPGINVFYKTVTITGPAGNMELVTSSNWDEDKIASRLLDLVVASPGNKPFVPDWSTETRS